MSLAGSLDEITPERMTVLRSIVWFGADVSSRVWYFAVAVVSHNVVKYKYYNYASMVPSKTMFAFDK